MCTILLKWNPTEVTQEYINLIVLYDIVALKRSLLIKVSLSQKKYIVEKCDWDHEWAHLMNEIMSELV